LSSAFKPKSFLKPRNEEELSNCLKEFGDRCRIIGGGTGIYEIAHRGLLSEVEVLLDINGIELSYIDSEENRVRIGSSTTMSKLLKAREIIDLKQFGGLVDALKSIQPLQVKNVATIAGAICTALPFFDLPVALLSLRSKVRIGPSGLTKELADFIKGYFSIDLAQGEFVKEIEVPIVKGNRASAFQKFSITHDDWALINCGVSVSTTTNCKNAREISDPVVFFGGGVGEKPVRAKHIEKSLTGLEVNEKEIKDIFEKEVPEDLETITDIRSTAEYRLHLAKVIGRRTCLEALARAEK
jgi:CO/xanthine dehydrogenase FAD-binding subunit